VRPQHFAMPEWLNSIVPPGPWNRHGALPYTMMGPFGIPYWSNHADSFVEAPQDSDDEKLSVIQAPRLVTATQDDSAPGVSLKKHEASLADEDEVGAPVADSLAKIVEKIWNRSNKEEIKDLYGAHRRPVNTPSLQKVTLDSDIAMGLSDKSRAKRTDALLHSINNAIAKSAIVITEIMDRNLKAPKSPDTCQFTVDQGIEAMKMLSYATSMLHSTRRDQIKQILDPAVRHQLCKNNTIESTNASHQLFGGDLQKQAKEAKDSKTLLLKKDFLFKGYRSPLQPPYWSANQNRGRGDYYNNYNKAPQPVNSYRGRTQRPLGRC